MVARRVASPATEDPSGSLAHANEMETGFLLLREWVVNALNAKKAGDSGAYQTLVNEMKSFHDDPLKLKVFAQCVAYFDEKYHELLINQILCISFWTCSAEISEVISDFVVQLIAANASFLNLCLNFVVNNFLPPSSGIPNFMNTVLVNGNPALNAQLLLNIRIKKDEQLSRKDEVFPIILKLIRNLLEISPMSNLRIQPIILQRMPHKLVEKDFQCVFIELIFQICSSDMAKSLGDNLLMAVIDRLVEIDVEIRWEDIIRSEEESENKIFLFHMELEDDFDGSENGDSDEDGENKKNIEESDEFHAKKSSRAHGLIGPKGKHIPSLDEMANKMDYLMDLFFSYIKKSFEEKRLTQIFNSLLKSFELTILNTYKSKFIQFILFYACSLSPENLSSNFCSLLLRFIVDVSKPRNIRMASCAYLASFLARAKFVPSHVIMNNITNLADWCLDYSEKDRKSDNNFYMNSSDFFIKKQMENQIHLIHGPFFSACQALFYILCYRMHELNSEYKTEKNLKNLPILELINSPLKPLSKCLDSVSEEFLKQTKMYNLFLMHSKKSQVEKKLNFENIHISSEKDNHKSEINFSHVAKKFGGEEKLEMFFPFDPYLLNYSSRFIRPIFNHWKQVLPEGLSDYESESENEHPAEIHNSDSDGAHENKYENEESEDEDDDDEDEEGVNSFSARMQMSLDSNPPFCSSSMEKEMKESQNGSLASPMKPTDLKNLIRNIYNTNVFEGSPIENNTRLMLSDFPSSNEKQMVGSYFSDTMSDDLMAPMNRGTPHGRIIADPNSSLEHRHRTPLDDTPNFSSLRDMPTRLDPSFFHH